MRATRHQGLPGRPGTVLCSPGPDRGQVTTFPRTLSPGNVLKELSDPAGAVIYTSRFQVGLVPPGLAASPSPPAPAIF